MSWQTAIDVLAALRDAFPDAHPSLSLDRETRSRLIVLLNPEPGKVYQYRLDASDLIRSVADVVAELKLIHQKRVTA